MKKDKGFTFIEIVISMAIIGILAIVFLTVFNTSLVNIMRAGVRTKAVGAAVDDFSENPSVISSKTIEIELPVAGGSSIIGISGSYARGMVTVTEGSVSNLNVEVEAFIPGYIDID